MYSILVCTLWFIVCPCIIFRTVMHTLNLCMHAKCINYTQSKKTTHIAHITCDIHLPSTPSPHVHHCIQERNNKLISHSRTSAEDAVVLSYQSAFTWNWRCGRLCFLYVCICMYACMYTYTVNLSVYHNCHHLSNIHIYIHVQLRMKSALLLLAMAGSASAFLAPGMYT